MQPRVHVRVAECAIESQPSYLIDAIDGREMHMCFDGDPVD